MSSQVAASETGISETQQNTNPEVYVPVKSLKAPITGGAEKSKRP